MYLVAKSAMLSPEDHVVELGLSRSLVAIRTVVTWIPVRWSAAGVLRRAVRRGSPG